MLVHFLYLLKYVCKRDFPYNQEGTNASTQVEKKIESTKIKDTVWENGRVAMANVFL